MSAKPDEAKVARHRQTGVYRISTPSVNDLVYIGSAARCLERRWITHVSALRKSVHHSPRLQAVVRKYGLSVLSFEVLELCEPGICVVLEQHYIDSYHRSKLYNVNPRAGSRLGARLTEKQRQLMAEARGGIASPQILAQIVSEYKEGATQAGLAKKFDVDRASIRNYLKRCRAEFRLSPGRDRSLRLSLKSDYLGGRTIRALAKDYRIDPNTVVVALRKSGIQLRSDSKRQKLRFQSAEARQAQSRARGGRAYRFIHRVHGEFVGYPFELADQYDLKSRSDLNQLVRGERLAYSGWEIADEGNDHKWKRPATRVFSRGENHQMFGKHHDQKTRSRIAVKLRKLSTGQIHAVRKLLSQGVSQSEIAQSFGISQSVVSRINTRSRGFALLD